MINRLAKIEAHRPEEMSAEHLPVIANPMTETPLDGAPERAHHADIRPHSEPLYAVRQSFLCAPQIHLNFCHAMVGELYALHQDRAPSCV